MSGKSAIVLQDVFLNLIRKDRVPIVIQLKDSTRLKGFVKGFDSFTVIMESEGDQVLVYKNAISLIQPSKPILM